MTSRPAKNFWARNIRFFLSLADLVLIYIAIICLQGFLMPNYFGIGTRIALIVATLAYIPVAIYLNRSKYSQRVIVLDRVFLQSFNAVAIHALFYMSLSAFLHLDYSITYYALLYGFLFLTFPIVSIAGRYALKQLRRKGRNSVKAAIIGTNNTSKRIAEALMTDPGFGYRIVGYFDKEPKAGFVGNYVGDIDMLAKYIEDNRVDEIYYTLVGEKAENMPQIVKMSDDNMLKFYYVPKISQYVNGGFELNNIGSMPVLSLRRNPLTNPLQRGLKRTFDIVFSSVFLILSPIIFIPVAIAIKTSSPGPVFFKQKRTGYHGKSFNCYKFRTMRVNAEADKAQATLNDPRKTKVGDFLRRTSIDELPQFINVWLGDMSVVGPRPHMLTHTEYYTSQIDKYMVRHIVKPGITGWAQVNGYRGITDQLWKMEKRVECDVWYIENWHFTLDLKIIVRTVMNAIHGEKNAF